MENFVRHAALALLAAPFAAFAAPVVTPMASLPYSFTGRVMNSRHEAFDTNMVAVLEAKDADGNLLAKSKTFSRAGSARNYALTIPVSSGSAAGYAVKDDSLAIEVTDSEGFVWTGVVDNAKVGAPGAVREVDIVLSEDLDGDGVDDELYLQLKAAWESSAYWTRGETFDINKDYDGDGVSTLNEALSGTDPFDPESKLSIVTYVRDVEYRGDGILEFETLGGHAYEVEETDNLASGTWTKRAFSLDGGSTEVDVISEPSAPPYIFRRTVYLKPKETDGPQRFYRVKAR